MSENETSYAIATTCTAASSSGSPPNVSHSLVLAKAPYTLVHYERYGNRAWALAIFLVVHERIRYYLCFNLFIVFSPFEFCDVTNVRVGLVYRARPSIARALAQVISIYRYALSDGNWANSPSSFDHLY